MPTTFRHADAGSAAFGYSLAQQAYARWGWRKVAKLQPYPDSPHFDAMVLPLR